MRNIKEDIIDINQVPINEIIDQYLKYVIQNKNTIDLSIAGKTVAEIALILKIKSETHSLTIKLTKIKPITENKFALSHTEKEGILKKLQECHTRDDGLILLSRELQNKKELEQFAKYLDMKPNMSIPMK